MFVYNVYECNSQKHVISPSEGVFGNFEAAENYILNIKYHKNPMVIIKIQVQNQWPVDFKNHVHNELTYYHYDKYQLKMVKGWV